MSLEAIDDILDHIAREAGIPGASGESAPRTLDGVIACLTQPKPPAPADRNAKCAPRPAQDDLSRYLV
jgi:hypothetical protein